MVCVNIISYRIQQKHAVVVNDDDKMVTLLPEPGANVVVNEIKINEKTELHHHDR